WLITVDPPGWTRAASGNPLAASVWPPNELLDPSPVGIRNVDRAIRPDGNAVHTDELPVIVAVAAKSLDQGTVGAQHRDTGPVRYQFLASVVHHERGAIRCNRHVIGTRQRSALPLLQVAAPSVEHLHAAVRAIGDIEEPGMV